jgi:hypothetical protein
MKYNKIDSRDALLMVRSLGLLLNQAAVYGPVHNVTNSAIKRVYQEFHENLIQYGAFELTVQSNLISVNGDSGDLDPVTCASLVRRFSQLDIDGLFFVNPLSEKEFEKCIKILAMPIALVVEASGVAELFKAEQLLSVSVVNIDYKRVDEESVEIEKDGVFDLSADLDGAVHANAGGVIDLTQSLTDADFNLDMFKLDAPDEDLEKAKGERNMQSAALADLLRKTAETLENSSTDCLQTQFDQVAGVLDQVKEALGVKAKGSQVAISLLAEQVNEDKFMVAGIEAEARLKGYSLKLTREDLLTRYAELNQELVQPLTVSTAVIDMLLGAKAGDVSDSQQELLKMAHESIERVNELVTYMNGVSGLPDSYIPDMGLINDSYSSNKF